MVVVATALVGSSLTAWAYQPQCRCSPTHSKRESKNTTISSSKPSCAGAQGKTDEAIRAAESVLAIECEILGRTSDDAIRTIKFLAKLHEEREDWPAARRAWTQVLAVWTKKLGKDHPDVIDARGDWNGWRAWPG